MTEPTSLVQHYGLALVFASAFIEQLGLPLPSYPVLLVAGALSYAGGDSLALIIAIGAAGTVLADLGRTRSARSKVISSNLTNWY